MFITSTGWALSIYLNHIEQRLLREKIGRAEFSYGVALESMGSQELAERAYSSAIKYLQDDPAPLSSRAALRLKRGNTEGAKEDAERAESLSAARRP